MKKLDLVILEGQLHRVLSIKEDKCLVINCIKSSMPFWTRKSYLEEKEVMQMSLLIINTMSEDDASAQNCIQQLIKDKQDYKVIHTENMKISPCIGCNVCWLKTPGICAIKDDYEEILKAYLQYDTVLLSLH